VHIEFCTGQELSEINFYESDPQRWYKTQSYNWQRGSISSKGAFAEYDPFKTPRELYEDFYLLMRKVKNYREVFSALGISYAKKDRQRIKLKKDYEEINSELMKQYNEFANRWGLLGCGFSRIIDTSYSGSRNEVIHEQGKVKKLILREADISLDINLPKTNKIRSLQLNRFETLFPDNLPASGGAVPLSVWEKDYTSINFRGYSESINALTGCRELLSILEDVNDLKCDNETSFNPNAVGITLHPTAVVMKEETITWKFNSLIQAISIIHGLNKSGQLSKPWGICQECGSIFSIHNKHPKKYCGDTCRNTVHKRNHRSKRKI